MEASREGPARGRRGAALQEARSAVRDAYLTSTSLGGEG